MAGNAATTEKIGRVGQRRHVVIPREFLETLNLREGDFVAFTRKDNGVLIKAKLLVDDDTVLTPEEAKMVRRGMKQIKEGRFKLWRARTTVSPPTPEGQPRDPARMGRNQRRLRHASQGTAVPPSGSQTPLTAGLGRG
jgi:bifunctional DNA-binding transcriptional regulator/antitoxin component of YhaV-PrlF toxin-antitoxin module